MTAIFEQESTVRKCDDDDNLPISEWFYETDIFEMLKRVDVCRGDTVVDAGCVPGVLNIRAAQSGLFALN